MRGLGVSAVMGMESAYMVGLSRSGMPTGTSSDDVDDDVDIRRG